MELLALPDGGRLAHEVSGTGPTLLLVMGTGADHAFWAPQVAALSDSFRVITYDSRGTGRSSDFARPGDCTPAALAADAAALLEAVAPGGPAHVAGLSLGSCVAQELALSRPELVRSLGLHGTWAFPDPWFLRMVESMEVAVASRGMPGFIRLATTWILSPDLHAMKPDLVLAMERDYVERGASRPHGVLAHCHADRVHDTRERLGRIRVPTLVTAGERDIQVPPRYGRQVAELIPGARWHLFEGPFSSHCACFEMADEWNAVTRRFLRET